MTLLRRTSAPSPLLARKLGMLTLPLLTVMVACSAPVSPPVISTATVRGQVIVPSAFLPAGASLEGVYAKTRVWLYNAANTPLKGTPVDAAGNYTLEVPASVSGQRLVAVIGSGSAAVGFETGMAPLSASSAHLDITLQSTVDNEYATDPTLKTSFDSAAANIWSDAFAAQGIAPIDPATVLANSLLLTGPDLSGDPTNALLGNLGLKTSATLGKNTLAPQGFLDGVGNFFGGVVNGVVGAVQGTVSAVVGGVSYAFNGLKDKIAGVTTPQEPRLIVDFDKTAKNLVLTGIGGKLISQDGGGLISQDGGGIIASGGGNIVASGGGNVISNDGGSITGQGLTAQASTFNTTPVGGVARFMGNNERCVSAVDQLTCVVVGNLLTAAVGEKAAVAIADAAMRTGNLRIAFTLGELLDKAKQAAMLLALQSSASGNAPALPTPITANPSRASNQRPLASIALNAGSGGSGTAPYTQNFDASASRDPDGSVSLYEWNFGDGSPLLRLSAASGAKVSHTFTRPSNFVVSLNVYDNAGAVSDAARQPITVFAATALPVISDPSPANLSLTAPVGGSASATVTYSNLGNGSLNADANPGSGWLSVLSNTPRPLAKGETATVTLKATCPATAGVLDTTLIITANDSRIPSKTVNVSLNCVAPLPAIGDPSPATLNLSAAVGTSVSGSFTYANTGAGPLSADVNPGSSWLSITSNTPKPLDAGATATVTLNATCPATAGPLSTTAIVTANDTRIPSRAVTVNLNCTAATVTTLSIGVTNVGGQSIPPYGTAANPAIVSGTVTVSGYVQAGANPVSRVQVLLVGNPYPVGQLAVSVPAGTRQDNVSQANLDTTQLSNGSYSFFVRAVDSTGASADSAPVTVTVNNVATPPANSSTAAEITQVNQTPISNGRNSTPLTVSGSVKVFFRVYAGSQGYKGNVYLCLQRGGNTTIGTASVNMLANGVGDFGYFWDSTLSGNTPAGTAYDTLFLTASPKCDNTVNTVSSTSAVQVKVSN